MSTYMYVECADHNPALRCRQEVGQHYYNLPMIFGIINDRDRFLRDCEENNITFEAGHNTTSMLLNNLGWCDLYPDKRFPGAGNRAEEQKYRASFLTTLGCFLYDHRHCAITVVNEYGETMTPDDATQLPATNDWFDPWDGSPEHYIDPSIILWTV